MCLQKIWKSKLRTTWKEVCIVGAYCAAKLFKTIFKACSPDVLLTMLRLFPDFSGDMPIHSSKDHNPVNFPNYVLMQNQTYGT